ncbi:DNA polymerase II large subunit [Candidatus Woesearchaeota archaeon]|nr:DNA polymerase II large subunit [Candidatus Woesearchaeota archaeon]
MALYSSRVEKIFDSLLSEVKNCYIIANKVKTLGYDPDSSVKIPLARNMAERVEGLIASVAPEVLGKGIPNRIQQLEKEFGSQDWRVALIIADEVAREKFCSFADKKKAIETGIRIGFAYVTVGVVSSPLEGFIGLEFRKRKDDGKEYFALIYGGPIRSAGGTGASVSVLIADYIRKRFGYAAYDATEKEIKRAYTELCDYHERVTNLQYFPSEDEVTFLVKNLPIQIDGDPSEKYDVSNYKDLDRRISNKISNGFCLVTAECLSLKAPKVWKQLAKWGKDMDLDQWTFMDSFVKLQKEVKARGAKVESSTVKVEKVTPDTTYIKDIVAGRPVFTYPLRNGGFRLRYGRGRVSGFSSDCVHPATMVIVDNFIAVGTQFKTERPGKSTTLNVCDSLDGPIVRLKNGDVRRLYTFQEAKTVLKEVDEIIYLGDILINWGDFQNRAHKLLPCGFVEEWWVYYAHSVFDKVGLDKEYLEKLYAFPIQTKVSFSDAVAFSQLGVPLHPSYIFYWNTLSKEEFMKLYFALKDSPQKEGKILISDFSVKRSLELIGCPHTAVSGEYFVVEGDSALALLANLGNFEKELQGDNVLEMVNSASLYPIKDKCGYFIGARMGRPEKAKMRKMTGSPHALFPVGDEGGRMRSLQSSLDAGKITSSFPLYFCVTCSGETIYQVCEKCGSRTERKWYCRGCNKTISENVCSIHGKAKNTISRSIDVKHYFYKALEYIGSRQYPEMIKGVRGLSSVEGIPEHMVKGILRAKYNLGVNKDGTVRYDMTELPCTHFKAKEVGTSLEKLRSMGYTHDVYGKELVDDNQVLELFAQDVILPSCPESPEEGADEILFRVAGFIDEELEKLYKTDAYYKLKSKRELVGHLIVAMSPHTSAGIICRIVGFSQVQGFYAHPLLHSIMRRDCLHYDTFFPYHDGISWKIEKIGELVEQLHPTKKVDMFGTKAVRVQNYNTLAPEKMVSIVDFTKHSSSEMLLLRTECGRKLAVTKNHIFYLKQGKKEAKDIVLGEQVIIPYTLNLPDRNLAYLDLSFLLSPCNGLMIRGIKGFVSQKIKLLGGNVVVLQKLKVNRRTFYNFLTRDSFSYVFVRDFLKLLGLSFSDLPSSAKVGFVRDSVSFPMKVFLDKDLMWFLGLYAAEGYSRSNSRFNQIDISASEQEVREKLLQIMRRYGLEPTHITPDRLVYSSKVLYLLIQELGCGSFAQEKRIPSLFLDLSKGMLKYFLQGYFDGDGSVSLTDCRVCCDSTSDGLLQDLEFVLKRYGIFVKFYSYEKQPGPQVKSFYIKKNKPIPTFKITKLIITSSFYEKFYSSIGFGMQRKQNILKQLVEKSKPYGMKIEFDKKNVYSKVVSIEPIGKGVSYCLNVNEHKILAHGILTNQCDGDENGCMLLMDTLLNFSQKYLPNTRGITQDAPLVLTGQLIPSEVDDMVFDMDIASRYPLELYESAAEYKNPWDVKIKKLGETLGTEAQYEGMMFTHDTDNFNAGVLCSSYKILPTMKDKVLGQMEVGRKIRAVDQDDVARLVIERHFIRDIKGNLRKFSQQSFRCVKCNEIYRRPPLTGVCTCGGKLVFTISQGSIVKYLDPALDLAEKYNLPIYLKQSLLLLRDRIESVFGKEEEKQEGLGKWF